MTCIGSECAHGLSVASLATTTRLADTKPGLSFAQAAGAGDIVSLAGIPTAGIADTICGMAVEEGLPPGNIEPPTLRCSLASATGWLQPMPGGILLVFKVLRVDGAALHARS